jgi:hypothetical protein
MNHTIGVELAQQSLRTPIKHLELFIFNAVKTLAQRTGLIADRRAPRLTISSDYF